MGNPITGGRILGGDSTSGPSETPIMQAMARQIDLNAALWKTLDEIKESSAASASALQRISVSQDKMAWAVELEHLPHAPAVAEIEIPGRLDGPFYGVYCIACTQAVQGFTSCQKPGENAVEMPEKWPLARVLVPTDIDPRGERNGEGTG